jgi:polyisoprenoid-binding protein YceI
MTGADRIFYAVDTRTSQFMVQAFASGMIAAVAHSPRMLIRDWKGTAQMNAGTLTDASLEVRVNPGSLEVMDELRDDDRRMLHRVMNDEVLETVRYPEVVYKSSGIRADKVRDNVYRFSISGKLSLHGVTNEQDVSCQVSFGSDSAHLNGTFNLLQSDYDIRIASIAGGTLKLRDELKFSFYVVARKVAEGKEATVSR